MAIVDYIGKSKNPKLTMTSKLRSLDAKLQYEIDKEKHEAKENKKKGGRKK